MATVNMNAPLCEGAETVRVGVVLTENPDCVVIDEEGHGMDYKSGKDEEAKSFSFDQVVTVDNIQSFHPELLQPLTGSISGGYNGALLICGASSEKISTLIDHSIIKQVLADLFSHMLSQGKEELFISVSYLQFYPDGSAVDLLSPNADRQTLKLVAHDILGSLVGGLSEVCVCSAEEAYALYETCGERLKANAGSISSRCSSLFSVAVEQELHPEEVESGVCRSRLQLFRLAGGASRTDLRGVTPLVKVVAQTQCEATTSDKILPFLLNDALTGNSRTALIYYIHPRGLLDDETPSALALAQKARNLVTKATVNRWFPRATEQKIRDDIADLRTVMMSQGESDVHNTFRLAELTQNLQIVKNQCWEKRREESKKIKGITQSCRTPNSSLHSSDHRECTDTMKYLQAQLKQEMEEHIRDGKGNVEKVQERVARIHQLREALREETLKNGAATEKSDLYQQSQLEYSKAQERRRQFKEDHRRLIQEEVEKMERDLAQEQLPKAPRESCWC
ncbi:kinesin-like protein KIF17 isoform X2 [Sander vitreus]